MAGLAGFPAAIYRHIGRRRNRAITNEKWNRLGDEMEATQTTFGLNPQGSYADVATRLAAMDVSIKALQGARIDLRAANTSGSENTSVTVTAKLLSIEGVTVANFSAAASITSTGVGGRDTGSATGGTWYYFYAGYNPTSGATGLMFSASSDRASITQPSGWTRWRLIGAVFYTTTPAFRRFFQHDDRVAYWEHATAFWSPTTMGTTAIQSTTGAGTLQDFVPPIVRLANVSARWVNSGGSAGQLELGPVSGTQVPILELANGATGRVHVAELELDSSQRFYARTSVGTANQSGAFICTGFKMAA